MNDDLQHNGPTIKDNDVLWRRISKEQVFFDSNLGRVRPSSSAFRDHRNGSPMSVALAEIFFETRNDPFEFLKGHDNVVALIAFKAGLARKLKQGVIRNPLPEEPAHAEVVGEKLKPIQREFAKSEEIQWIVYPPEDLVKEKINSR